MSNKPSTIGEVRQSLWDSNKPVLPEMSWDQHCTMFDTALMQTKGMDGLEEAYQPLFDNLARTYLRMPLEAITVPEPTLGIVYQRIAQQHAEVMSKIAQLGSNATPGVDKLGTETGKPVSAPAPATPTITLDLIEITVMLDTLIASNHSSDFHYDLQSRKDVAGEVLKKLRATNVSAALEAAESVLPSTSGATVPAVPAVTP